MEDPAHADGILLPAHGRRYSSASGDECFHRFRPGQHVYASSAQRGYDGVLSCGHAPLQSAANGCRFDHRSSEPAGLPADLREARQHHARAAARFRQAGCGNGLRHSDGGNHQIQRRRERLFPEMGRISGFGQCPEGQICKAQPVPRRDTGSAHQHCQLCCDDPRCVACDDQQFYPRCGRDVPGLPEFLHGSRDDADLRRADDSGNAHGHGACGRRYAVPNGFHLCRYDA